MGNESKKIVLPKELQVQMLNFFMKTSIPKKMREQNEQNKPPIKK